MELGLYTFAGFADGPPGHARRAAPEPRRGGGARGRARARRLRRRRAPPAGLRRVGARRRPRSRRGWPPLTRAAYEAAATLRGASFVGSPERVAEKILYQHELFRHDRFLLQLSVGSMPQADMLRAIELYGTEVAPLVRAELARHAPAPVRA